VRSTFSVLAAGLVLAASTGCGDDDEPAAVATTGATTAADGTTAATTAADDYTRPEPPPEQSRWAMQVDEACGPVQEQIDALPPPSDASSLVTWVEQVVPLVGKEVAAVKAVKPSTKEDEARNAELFIASLESIESALTKYLAALQENDTAAIEQALAEANAAGVQARTYAVSLDVTRCGGYSGS
jgi:hypothetical protein